MTGRWPTHKSSEKIQITTTTRYHNASTERAKLQLLASAWKNPNSPVTTAEQDNGMTTLKSNGAISEHIKSPSAL